MVVACVVAAARRLVAGQLPERPAELVEDVDVGAELAALDGEQVAVGHQGGLHPPGLRRELAVAAVVEAVKSAVLRDEERARQPEALWRGLRGRRLQRRGREP